MSSEQLADGVNPLDAELAATWDVLKGYSGRDTDLGIARRFGGAAAAYSLRDIGAMNGPVVKVRRMPYDVGDADGAGGNPDTSPNDETDFSANQVATGALEDWVNGKLEDTLPCNVGDDFASGSFVVSNSNSAFVNGTYTFNSSNSRWEKSATTYFHLDSSTWTLVVGASTIAATTNGEYPWTSIYSLSEGNISFGIEFSSIDFNTAAAAYSLRKVKDSYSGNAVRIRRSSDDIEVDVAFDSDGKVSASSAITNVAEEGGESGQTTDTTLGDFINGTDAFVHTWYDQAGSNDAVQATAGNQPQIANNGALLTDENGLPEIKFTPDASNGKFLQTASDLVLGASLSLFFKANLDSSNNGARVLSKNNSFTDLIMVNTSDIRFQYNRGTTILTLLSNLNVRDSEALYTIISDGSNLKGHQNGGSAETDSFSNTSDFTLNRIGSSSSSSSGSKAEFSTSELVLFNTDQSDNRFKIESNINNYYGLYNDENEASDVFQGVNYTVTDATKTGFTIDIVTATGVGTLPLVNAPDANETIYVSYNLTINSGSPSINVVTQNRSGSTITTSADFIITEAGFYAHAITPTQDGATHLSFADDADNVNFTISDLKISRIARDGFVETWYDQSSNGNDATQATASKQPKIVSNGGTNKLEGLPTINFDDATSHCLTSSSYSRSGSDLPLSMMAVFDKSTTDTDYLFAANKSNDDAFQRLVLRSTSFEYGERDDSNTQKIGTGGSPSLNTIFLMSAFTGGTTSSAFVNGSSIISDQDTDLGTQTFDQIDIGANNGDGSSSANPFSGNISELYLFETNLSTDRTTIESEIANHYNITLS